MFFVLDEKECVIHEFLKISHSALEEMEITFVRLRKAAQILLFTVTAYID